MIPKTFNSFDQIFGLVILLHFFWAYLTAEIEVLRVLACDLHVLASFIVSYDKSSLFSRCMISRATIRMRAKLWCRSSLRTRATASSSQWSSMCWIPSTPNCSGRREPDLTMASPSPSNCHQVRIAILMKVPLTRQILLMYLVSFQGFQTRPASCSLFRVSSCLRN